MYVSCNKQKKNCQISFLDTPSLSRQQQTHYQRLSKTCSHWQIPGFSFPSRQESQNQYCCPTYTSSHRFTQHRYWKKQRNQTSLYHVVNLTADIERKKRVPPPPVPTPEELVGMFFKWADPPHTRGFATLPYIKGLTEPLTRLFRHHDILVTSKPVKTLQQEFPAPKFRPEKEDQCNVIYKFPYSTCSWSYIGETGAFNTRKKRGEEREVKYLISLFLNLFFSVLPNFFGRFSLLPVFSPSPWLCFNGFILRNTTLQFLKFLPILSLY